MHRDTKAGLPYQARLDVRSCALRTLMGAGRGEELWYNIEASLGHHWGAALQRVAPGGWAH